MTKNGILRKTGKIFLYIVSGVFILVVLSLIFITTKTGKNFVRKRAESYLTTKLHTKISIGSIDYSLPKWVELKNLYIEDQNKDTLLFGEELSVDLEMLKLISGNTHLRKVALKNILINVNRQKNDSLFNYQFIVDAFTGNKSTTTIKDTAALKLSLDRLIFNNVKLNFKDLYGGSSFNAGINDLDTKLDLFQPDRLKFGITNFSAVGVSFLMEMFEGNLAAKKIVEDTTVNDAYYLLINSEDFNLRDVDVKIDDKTSGMFYSNNVKSLGLTKAVFDVKNTFGKADKIFIDTTEIKFESPFSKQLPSDSTSSNTWKFDVKNISLKNDKIIFNNNNIKPTVEGLDANHLDAKNINAFINSFKYSSDTISASIKQFAFADKSGFQIDTTHADFIFSDKKLEANNLYVKTPSSIIQKSIKLSYDSIAGITLNPERTLVDVVFTNSTIAFNDIYTILPSLKKTLSPQSFKNKYVSFNTEMHGSLKQLFIPSLKLSGLDGSSINAKGILYNLNDANKFSYSLTIFGSNIKKQDLLKFVPPEKLSTFKDLPPVFSFNGTIKGNKNDLAGNINVKGDGIEFQGNINLKNISDPANLKYDVAMQKGSFSKSFILSFIPPGSLPEGFNIPDRINAIGEVGGSTNDLKTNLQLITSFGNAKIKGFIKNITDPKKAVYDLVVSPSNFNIGKLIGNDTLGLVSGQITAKGKGFDYKTMVSDINAKVSSLRYNGYTYTNANLKAELNNGNIKSIGDINDPALKLNYNLEGNVSGEYPELEGFVRIDTAQLKTLNLYDDTLNVSLTANINANSLVPHKMNAGAIIDSIYLTLGKNLYKLDTINFIAKSENGIDSINFNSEFANILATGNFDYTKVGPSIIQYINKFFPINKSKNINAGDQQIALTASIEPHPLIKDLIPNLTDFERISINGKYDTSLGDSALNLNVEMPFLSYGGKVLRMGKFDINSKNEKLNYEILFDTLDIGNNVFYSSIINGSAANDSLTLKAVTKDGQQKDWFALSSAITHDNDSYTIRLNDAVILNYESWKVNQDNYIKYSPKGILVNNFIITSDTASISINSKEKIPDSPIDIHINNFNLKSISSFVNRDTVFLAGIMNADLVVSDFKKAVPAFTGNAKISSFEFKQQPIGDIAFNARKESDDLIISDLQLTGNENDIKANLSYDLNTELVNGKLNIHKLNFKTIQGISAGQIERASGNVHGQIDINGKVTQPQWNGIITFDTTSFALSQFGAPYKINNQSITLQYPNINFNNFLVQDSLNNPLKIDGRITSLNNTEFRLGLNANAKDFIIIDAPKAIGHEIYGFAAINSNINITGTSEVPIIEGNISVNDNSDITLVLPENNFDKEKSKSIVRFVDADTFDISKTESGFVEENEGEKSFAKFLNYNLNVTIGKTSALTIIIDPVTGDELRVQGDAQLNAGVDPGGNIILSGTYTLDKGSYVLNYQFLQRKFILNKGSTITFSGPPLNARVNITAEYIANTSSKELLSNEVSSADPVLANSYNQKIPYHVVLKLSGILSKPDIKFDVQLPDEESNVRINSNLRTTVENKLTQLRGDESAMNKQVFSLLLLNRFVGEQSSDFFSAGEGGGFEDLARQSVSQFLSSALNQIADDLIKGVDIDLSLQSYQDYSGTGSQQRTDLNLSLSKSFLNNRLTVTVGKNFGVEGEDPTAKSNTFIPDITFGYKLTSDGKYMLKAYRKSQFEVVLDGYVAETGVGFLMTMDYDKFRELFQKRKKK